MSLSVKIDQKGDVDKSLSLLPMVKNLMLMRVKRFMELGGLKSYDYTWRLEDGSLVRINANLYGLEPMYGIGISSPLVPPKLGKKEEEKEIILVLVTIAKPFEEGSSLDESGEELYLPYFYSFKNGVLRRENISPLITYREAWELNIQSGASELYACVSNYYSHKETLDWIKTANPVYDENVVWGDIVQNPNTFVDTVVGADKAQKSRGGPLLNSFSARQNYFYSGDSYYKDLRIIKTGIDNYILEDILESSAPLRRLFVYEIESKDINDSIITNTLGVDIYGGNPYSGWTYHIPIVAVAHNMALLRKVVRTKNPNTYTPDCYQSIITEELKIGNEAIASIQTTKTRTGTGFIIEGSPVVGRNTNHQYTLNDCWNVEWSVSGTGMTISQSGLLSVGGTACGAGHITARCVHCNTTAYFTVRVNVGVWCRIATCNDPFYADSPCSTCQNAYWPWDGISGEYYSYALQTGYSAITGHCGNPSGGGCPSYGLPYTTCTDSYGTPLTGGPAISQSHRDQWKCSC